MSEAVRPVQVIVAYDFTPSAEHALARAIEVVARAPHHVLHIASVLDPHDRFVGGGAVRTITHETASRIQQLILDNMTKAFAGRDTAAEVQVYVHARIGSPASELLALAAELGADLIFIGSHGKTGVERLVLGSVSERVVREARCPVMVVRPKGYDDVQLLHVTEHEHAPAAYRAPHRYSYNNRQILVRPPEWPLS